MAPSARDVPPESVPPFTAVVPAAGAGVRMQTGRRKPFLALGSAPVLLHTLCRLSASPACRQIVLAVHADDMPLYSPARRQLLRDEFRVTAVVPGGANRQESVRTALDATEPEPPLVLIHDAVRPLVRVALVEAVAARAAQTGAALAAAPAVATIKEVDADGRVLRTPARESLWVAQTPQGFHREVIVDAHARAAADGFLGTDDALLVERIGHPVAVVEDSPDNIKITTPEDLAIAEAVLRWQRENGVPEAALPIPAADMFSA